MSEFQIVTVSTGKPIESYYCWDEFHESLARFGHKAIVLNGNGQVWGGLGSKPKFLKKAIEDGTINAKYILFTDSWDVVFAQSPEIIMEKFKSFHAPFVCSAEKNCFPSDLKDHFPQSPTNYNYLNSGFIVARTAAMLAVLESMDLENEPDDHRKENGEMYHANDQFFFQKAFVKQPVKMVLDHYQMLSQTMCEVTADELSFDEPLILNLKTGTRPAVFHFNGPAKTAGLREPILKHLGL